MRRFVVVLAMLAFAVPVRGQSPVEMAKTAALIESWQNPDGGFGAAKGEKSSLGATSSAIRMLKNVGGSIPDIAGCRAYVTSCFDPTTGAFTNEPGGKPGVAITASGLMAVGELGTATDKMILGAIGYFGKEAQSFEDVRIAVAGLEAVKKRSLDFARWSLEIEADRNPDGTWGKGGEQAFATGSRVAALLRMGAPIDKPDAVLAAMKAGQRPDGGWSKDGTTSDLGSTYRIMRSFFMMKARPDLEAVRSYLMTHRQEDGGYASKPGGKDGGGTYFVTTVNRWVRLLSGEPAVVETAGFTPLFDGKTLDGWEGDTALWSAKDGMLVGTSPGLKHNDFLSTAKSYDDFVLKFSFRMTGDPNANSGVQFRSVRVPGHEMSGYQADIGQGYWGCLYDESRRNKVLVDASQKAKDSINRDGWNQYVIRCMGDHITLSLNGVQSVDYVEKVADIARGGKIAVQIHAGGPMKIEFKDILIQPLPRPTADNADTPGFHLRTLKDSDRKYAVYLPVGFDASKTYPAILFLHGSGERGSDGILPAQVGLGPSIAKTPDRFPAIVILPQAREGWSADGEDIKAALAALDEVSGRYKIDAKRTYLTGLSMGGLGSWGLAAKSPERFAAVAPVCGFGDNKWAESLKGLPIWTLVGDDDHPRIVGGTRALVEAVKAAGGSPRWTEYRGVGHNSWDRAYADPKLLDWMLAQGK
ncbi:MAG: putative peptidase [Planctomycetota bacterium]|nr:putative peptidase [Planctomycetota bacterium]